MRISNAKQFPSHPIDGSQPELFHGTDRPDTGTRFTEKPIGTLYVCKVASGQTEIYQKVTDADSAYDWALVRGTLQQTAVYTDFTDGGAAAGTLNLTNQLPAGSVVDSTKLKNITGFAGDTSAVLIVGVAGDTDAFMTGTPDVFSDAAYVDAGPPSGDRELEAATTVLVTVTSAADFTAVSAGSVTIEIAYH